MKPLFRWFVRDFIPMAVSGVEMAASGVELYDTARYNDRYLCIV